MSTPVTRYRMNLIPHQFDVFSNDHQERNVLLLISFSILLLLYGVLPITSGQQA
jgi:hypothetical protein